MLKSRNRRTSGRFPQIEQLRTSKANKENEPALEPLTKGAWLPVLSPRRKRPVSPQQEPLAIQKEQKLQEKELYYHSIPQRYKESIAVLALFQSTLELHRVAEQFFSLMRLNQLNNILKHSQALNVGKATDKVLLLFDLDQTLVHTEQTRNSFHDREVWICRGGNQAVTKQRSQFQKAMYVSVRPHVQEVLDRLASSGRFQLGVFTASSRPYAEEIIRIIDPLEKYFTVRLFREHCSLLANDVYVKDLRRIAQQPIQRILLVDNSPFSYIGGGNLVPILPYYHFREDRELLSLADYLLSLPVSNMVALNRQHFSGLIP